VDAEASDARWLEDSLSHVKELSDRVTELSTLMGISTLLSSERPLSQSLESVCRLSAEICKSQVSFLHLTDGEDDLVCVARHAPGDALEYAWEGIARIYGRKAIQKSGIVLCSNLLLRREVRPQDEGQPRMGGICAIPLKGKTRVVGTMEIGYAGPHRFSAREKDMLSAIAAQVAMAVERSWLIDQLQEQLARADSLREAGTKIGSNLELDLVLDSIVNHAARLLAAEFSGIFLVEQPTHQDSGSKGKIRGGERGQPRGNSLQLEDVPTGSAIRQAVETGRPAVVQNPRPRPSSESLGEPAPMDYRVALAIPLVLDNEILGALVTSYLERRRFDASDISLAEAFAHQAALAIRNARLYEEAMGDRLSLEAAINQINNHGISLLDGDLNISFANPATFWLLGVGPKGGKVSLKDWIAHVKRGLVEGEELDRVIEQLRADPEATVVAELLARGSADSHRSLQLLSLPLRQADGSLKGRVNVLEEGR
jgi:GAF domain-containing protein